MRQVGYVVTTARDDVLDFCNVLLQEKARIISISKPTNFGFRPKSIDTEPETREYEIWFEHERAGDKDWNDQVWEAATELRGQRHATVPKSG